MINFEKDQLFNKTFWKYRLGEEEHIDMMAFSMLSDNRINGIVTVNKRNQDSDTWLYFDVTGFSEVMLHPELIAEDRRLLQFLKDICRIYNDCDSYLLDRSHVLIENTFANAEGNAELLYVPVDEICSESDIQTFLLGILQAIGGVYRGPRKVFQEVFTLISGNGFTLSALERLLSGLLTDGVVGLDQNLAGLHAQPNYRSENPGAVQQNNGAKDIAVGIRTAANGFEKLAENAANKISDNFQSSLAGTGDQRSAQGSMELGIDNPFGASVSSGTSAPVSQPPKTKHGMFGSKKHSAVPESPYVQTGQRMPQASVSPREAKKFQKEQAKQQKEFEKQKKLEEKALLKQEKALQKQQAKQERLIKRGKLPAGTPASGMDNPFTGHAGTGMPQQNGQPQQRTAYTQPGASNAAQKMAVSQPDAASDQMPFPAGDANGGYTIDLEEYLRQQEQMYRQSHPKNPMPPTGPHAVLPQRGEESESGGTVLMDEGMPTDTVLMDHATQMQPRYALLHERTQKSYPIVGSNVHIGRGKGIVDICIDNPTKYMGSDHAYITTEGEKIFFTDNNSKNHSWLNEERITPELKYELHPGDRIRMADEIFTVQQLQ